LPSRLRVTSYLSQERREEAAQAFIHRFKAPTDARAPFFTSDKPPAYVAALAANSSVPEPLPGKGGPGRPPKQPKRLLDPQLR
jgi:transposase-like protein